MIYYDSATQLPPQTSLNINQYNRKSSMEAKIGLKGQTEMFSQHRNSTSKGKQRQRGNS